MIRKDYASLLQIATVSVQEFWFSCSSYSNTSAHCSESSVWGKDVFYQPNQGSISDRFDCSFKV